MPRNQHIQQQDLDLFDQPIQPDRAMLKDAILNILHHEEPMKAKHIASVLTHKFGVMIDKHIVNSIIYKELRGIVIVRKPECIVVLAGLLSDIPQSTPGVNVAPKQPAQPDIRNINAIPISQVLTQIRKQESLNWHHLFRRAIGFGYAFLAFEIIKLLFHA
jgi:hypothetical protein